ncbi:hypothetical protein [Pedobacter africanus]|uniref:Quinol monooxygenase YgiN n=1 Tax=Pedobacter africanus TaxID=151894 RepID=A0A1W1ZS50_9SPHI|nr:hypothetical protein [Pedobacter africanus]SMC51269.1 hypothetical protein SAMN04488524_0946 [Pedobacter africanus]
MKSVKVTYTVKSSFVEQNKANINVFINELKESGNADVRYSIYLGEDGRTFTHISLYSTETAQEQFLDMESFKAFQQQRDESGLEAEPSIEVLNFVAGV